MDELCAEWQPEPLCGPLTEAQRKFEPPVISRWVSHITSSITMGQKDICTDLASPAWSRTGSNAQRLLSLRVQIAWSIRLLHCSSLFLLTGQVQLTQNRVRICFCLCSAAGVYIVANGKKALNMVSFNFLGVAGNASIKVHFPALKCPPPTLLTGGSKCYQ